jgi:hypothetical protein
MAEAATKLQPVEFVTEYTKVWLKLNGRKDGATVIQPPLNAKGREALEKYRTAEGDATLDEFPVHLGFPFPKGGFAQYLPKPIMEAWAKEWAAKVLPRAPKMTLDIDGDFVGNSRIRINRLLTPTVYAVFCEPFPPSTGGKKGGSKPAPQVVL